MHLGGKGMRGAIVHSTRVSEAVSTRVPQRRLSQGQVVDRGDVYDRPIRFASFSLEERPGNLRLTATYV